MHWGYPLTNEVDCWGDQLDYVTLSENGFWSINYTLVTWSKWWRHLSSPFVTGPSFNFISYMKIEISRGAHHVFKKISAYGWPIQFKLLQNKLKNVILKIFPTILFNCSCCYIDSACWSSFISKNKFLTSEWFFQKKGWVSRNLVEIIRKIRGEAHEKHLQSSNSSLFLLDSPSLLQLFILRLFYICLPCGLCMFTICLQKHSSHSKNFWNQMLSDAERMSKVNIEDASFGRFSK